VLPNGTSDPAATLANLATAGGCFLSNKTIAVARPTEAAPGTVEACGLNSICHRATFYAMPYLRLS
jgi:hypothetical protein